MLRVFGEDLFYWNGARGRNANTFPTRCERSPECDVDTTPTVGSVMYEPAGRYGHVAVVTELYLDGSFKVEECNYVRGRKTARVLSSRRGLKFLHPTTPETRLASNTGSERVMVAGGVLAADMSDPLAQEFVPVEQMELPAETPLPVETPIQRDAKYVLPESAISSSDAKEDCRGLHTRFCKVPRYLVPLYEATSEKYDIPVKYLAADGSYETGFTPARIGDHGTSCGLHQFHRNSRAAWPQNWGFKNLEDCLDPASNIDKVGEVWDKARDGVCRGDIGCAIRRHNGKSAYGYQRAVMNAADLYYAG